MNRLRQLLGTPAVLLRRLGATARLLVVAAFIAMLAAGGAVAYWTTSGAGAASASAGTLNNVIIGTVTFGTPGLYPAGPAVNVSIPLTNPNSYAVDIDSITIGAAGITSSNTACTASTGVSLNLTSITGSIPANTTNTYITSASMSAASVTDCQGTTFTAPLTLVVHK